MPTSIPLLQIDAFTSRPFFGNPAAVMWLQHPHDDDWMQHVASEMNLSETAFLSPTDQTHRYGLRWFTPGREVDLCGHATIASMMALRHWGFITDAASVTFDSRSGDLHCELEGDMASLKFPATPVIEQVSIALAGQLCDALRIPAQTVHRSIYDLVVELESESQVQSVQPDFGQLSAIDTRGIIVTARSETPDRDFVSRFFAPACGINEDPVTGSAHCCLAPYWMQRLGRESGKTIIGRQLSRRAGTVTCQVLGDHVRLTGQAVIVMDGTWIA